jgi:hypothetical protein
MKRLLSIAAVAGALLSAPSLAQSPSPVAAFAAAVNGGDAQACLAVFAPSARFIDLGNDFTAIDRRTWFCGEVVRVKGNYATISETRSGDRIDWTFDFRAGGYFLQGKGVAKIEGDRIADLVIEKR